MAHAIPKIHFSNVSQNGDTTNLNDTVNGIADTSKIQIGMYVEGSGIPANTTVLAVTVNAVQLSAQATATAAAVALNFFNKIEFEYPPVEESGEKKNPQERRSVALSGMTQVSIDYTEAIRDLNFSFLSNALYLQLQNFYDTSAMFGESFRYFDDKTTTNYLTYELRKFDWTPRKIAARGTTYIWDVPLQFRRVA